MAGRCGAGDGQPDHFGVSYASLLDQLRGGPFGQLKFGLQLARDPGLAREWDMAQRAVVDLCAGLGIEVAARDVEDEAHLAALGLERYVEIQGRLCGGPMSAAGISAEGRAGLARRNP
jgi:EAL domain-containing protein (putative c-di-GMP-specific phosphodiesterase class I)